MEIIEKYINEIFMLNNISVEEFYNKLCVNPNFFTYNYEEIKKIKSTINEEIIKNRFHPQNMKNGLGGEQMIGKKLNKKIYILLFVLYK